MDQSSFIVMTAFFVVAAVAIVMQAGMLYGIYTTSKSMQRELTRLMPRIEGLLNESSTAVADLKEIATKSNEILNVTRSTVDYADQFVHHAGDRARAQFDRADRAVDDAVRRAQSTAAQFGSGVMKPVRTIGGVARGLGAALHYLAHERPRNGFRYPEPPH